MKFTAPATNLAMAAKAAQQLLDKKHDLFSQLLLVASNGRVCFHATNGAHFLVFEIEDAKITKPGRALLPGVRLTALLGKLQGEVAVSLSRSQLVIDAGDRFSLKTGEAKHYPPMPTVPAEDDSRVVLDGTELKRVIAETSYAAMQSDNGVGLCGVYLCAQEGKAEAVATDGVSFSKSEMPATGTLTGHTDPISLSGLTWLHTSLNAGDQVVLQRSQSYWCFQTMHRQLWLGRAARNFPDYSQLLAALSWSHKLSLDRKALNSGLMRTLAMFSSKEPQKTIELQASNAGLTILASSDCGMSKVELECQVDGEPATVSLDAYRLWSALRILKDQDTVTLHIGAERAPIKLNSPARDNHLALVAVVLPRAK